MHRHCITSAGPVVIGVERLGLVAGVAVTVTCFHADGWERPPKVWTSAGDGASDETLAEFLGRLVPLPKREASSLARKVLELWLHEAEARTEEAELRRERRQVRLLAGAAAAVGLLALVGAASLVWVVAT